MHTEAQTIISKFNLQKHPEGGYYKETYKANLDIIPCQHYNNEKRKSATAIYYLLADHNYSTWHRLKADEILHFYAGFTLLIHILTQSGQLVTKKLGMALNDPETEYQVLIPANHWFALELKEPEKYSFIGTTVSPGFEFVDFEIGHSALLCSQYPQHKGLIARLSRDHHESK